MATYDLQETYTTKNGLRLTATELTEDVTTGASTVSLRGYTVAYGELAERPSSAETLTPSIDGFTETSAQNPDTDEFYVDYRTGRLYFNSANVEETYTVTYYGYGSIIRNEHINTLQTDLNALQLRAMTALNGIHWALGDDGSGTISYTAGAVTCSSGIIYLPPAFDALGTDRIYHAGLSSEPVADGSVIYCTIDSDYISDPSPDPRIDFSVDTYDNYCDLTSAALLIAARRGSYLYIINGIVLASGDSWTPSDGSGSGSGDVSKYVGAMTTQGPTTITHSLGTQSVVVQVYDNNGELVVPDVVDVTGDDTISVSLTSHSVTGSWPVVVMG